jgi:peptidase S24-like protein
MPVSMFQRATASYRLCSADPSFSVTHTIIHNRYKNRIDVFASTGLPGPSAHRHVPYARLRSAAKRRAPGCMAGERDDVELANGVDGPRARFEAKVSDLRGRRVTAVDCWEIVAAMIDGEATVKVYRRRGGHVLLEPRNPAYEVIDGDRAAVLGIVVSVLRSL